MTRRPSAEARRPDLKVDDALRSLYRGFERGMASGSLQGPRFAPQSLYRGELVKTVHGLRWGYVHEKNGRGSDLRPQCFFCSAEKRSFLAAVEAHGRWRRTPHGY